MFRRLIPNLKRIHLLSDRMRPHYEAIGLLRQAAARRGRVEAHRAIGQLERLRQRERHVEGERGADAPDLPDFDGHLWEIHQPLRGNSSAT